MTRIVDTGFDASSTAAQVVAGIDLHGRVALVTGAASGIGVETARALAAAGARTVLAVRDPAAGEAVAADLRASTGNDAVEVRPLDLADLVSVDAFVAAWEGPLHVLVANAGVMTTPETYTAAGWELQFATNHLGHVALALGLHPALAAGGSARVVVVSSSGHGNAPVDFDDLFFLRRPYDPEVLASVKEQAAGAAKTPEQGAATSVLLATSPLLEGVGGRYFEDCHEAEVVDEVVDGLHGVVGWALDPDAARRLWDVSVALIDAERRRAARR